MTQTIRLTAKEQSELKNLAFELNKSLIKKDLKNVRFYKEADIVHFLLKECANRIGIDKNGSIYLL